MQKSKSGDVAVATGSQSSSLSNDNMLEMDSPVASPRAESQEPVFCTGPRAAVVAIGFVLVALLIGWSVTLTIIAQGQNERIAQLQDQLNRIPVPVLQEIVGIGPPSPSLGLDGTIYIDSNNTAGVLYYKTTQWNQYSQTLYPSSMYGKRAAPLAPSAQWVIIGAGALLGGTDMSGLTTNATVRNVGGVSAARIANSTVFVESLLPTIDPATGRPRITVGDVVFANGSNTNGVQIQADANSAETLLIGAFPTGSSPTTGVTVQINGAIVGGVTQEFIVDSNGYLYVPGITTASGFVSNSSGTFIGTSNIGNVTVPAYSGTSGVGNFTTCDTPDCTRLAIALQQAFPNGTLFSPSFEGGTLYVDNAFVNGVNMAYFLANSTGIMGANVTAKYCVARFDDTMGKTADCVLGVILNNTADLSGLNTLTANFVLALQSIVTPQIQSPTGSIDFTGSTLTNLGPVTAQRLTLSEGLSTPNITLNGNTYAYLGNATALYAAQNGVNQLLKCATGNCANYTGGFTNEDGSGNLVIVGTTTTMGLFLNGSSQIQYTGGILHLPMPLAVSGAAEATTLSLNGSPSIGWTSGTNTVTLGSNLDTGTGGTTTHSVLVNGQTNLGPDGSVTNVAYLQATVINLGGKNYTGFNAGNGVGNVTVLYSTQNAIARLHRCETADCGNVTGTLMSEDVSGNVVIVGTTTTAGLVLNGSSTISYNGANLTVPANLVTSGSHNVYTTILYATQVQATLSMTAPTVSATSVLDAATVSLNGSPTISWTSGTNTVNFGSNLDTGSAGIATNHLLVNGSVSLAADGSITGTTFVQTQILGLNGHNYTAFTPGSGFGNVTALYSTLNGVNKLVKCQTGDCANVTGGWTTEDGSGNLIVIGTVSSAGLIVNGSSTITYSSNGFAFPAAVGVTGLLSTTTGLSIAGSGTISYSGGNYTFPGNVIASNIYTTGTLWVATLTVTGLASLQSVSIGGSAALTYSAGTLSIPVSTSVTGLLSTSTGLSINSSPTITYTGSNYTFTGTVVATNVYASNAIDGATITATTSASLQTLSIGGSAALTYSAGTLSIPVSTSVTGLLSTSTGLSINSSPTITYTGTNYTFTGSVVATNVYASNAVSGATVTATSSASLQTLSIGGSAALTYSAGTLSIPVATSITGLLSTSVGLSINSSPTITYTGTNYTFTGNMVASNFYTSGAVLAGTVTATSSASLQTLSIGGSPAVTYTSGTSTLNMGSNVNTGSFGVTTNNMVVNGGTTLGADSSIKNVAYLQTSIINLGGTNYTYFGPGVGVGNVTALYSAQNGVNKFTKCAVASCANVTGTFANEDSSGNVVFTGTLTTTGLLMNGSSAIIYSGGVFDFPAGITTTGTLSTTAGLSINGSPTVTYAASVFSFTGGITSTGTITGTTGVATGTSGPITYSSLTFQFPSPLNVTGQVATSAGFVIKTSQAIGYAAPYITFPESVSVTDALTATSVCVGSGPCITYSLPTSKYIVPAGMTITGNISVATAITTSEVSTTNIDLVTINGYTYQVVVDVTFTTPSSVVQTYTLPSTTQYLLVTMTGGGGNGWTYGGGGAAGAIFNYMIYVSNQFSFSYFVGTGSAYGSGVNGTSSNFTYTTDNTIGTTIWLLTEGGGYGAYSNANPPGGMGGGVWINGMYIKGGWPGEKGFTCTGGSFITAGTPGETWVGPAGAMAYGGGGGSATCDGADKTALPGTCANVATSAQLTGGVSCMGYTGPGAGGSYASGGARGGGNGLLRIQGLRR